MAGSSPVKAIGKSNLMRRWLYVLPVVVFGLMAAAFYRGLRIDSNVLPSALINEEAPQFDLPPLPGHDKGLSAADLKGQVSLVNMFASWCAPCRVEHPVLVALAKTKRVPIYGVDYKDAGDAALAWLAELGDPYARIGADSGQVGIEWGVYGVPETYVIDKTGHIRYKHVGPMSADDINNTILPLVARLQQ
jgi:cytochrome c biogenesis protein CcmG, thiol:disulfide interchange protein DsbE